MEDLSNIYTSQCSDEIYLSWESSMPGLIAQGNSLGESIEELLSLIEHKKDLDSRGYGKLE